MCNTVSVKCCNILMEDQQPIEAGNQTHKLNHYTNSRYVCFLILKLCVLVHMCWFIWPPVQTNRYCTVSSKLNHYTNSRHNYVFLDLACLWICAGLFVNACSIIIIVKSV